LIQAAARSANHAAISVASQPVAPGDSRRRRGKSPTRSNRQRVERDKPVIRRHSDSRMMASLPVVAALIIAPRSPASPFRLGFGAVLVAVFTLGVPSQCTTGDAVSGEANSPGRLVRNCRSNHPVRASSRRQLRTVSSPIGCWRLKTTVVSAAFTASCGRLKRRTNRRAIVRAK
jgi:hypothetical protein